jgi:hypothetical protein
MSRGAGHVQQTILSLIAGGDDDRAWTVSELCALVYSEKEIEKKHRVAVTRALRCMTLPGAWRVLAVQRLGGEYCLCNACSLLSMARRDYFEYLNRARRYGWKEVADLASFMDQNAHRYRPGDEHNTFGRVQHAVRFRDASQSERVDIEIQSRLKAAAVMSTIGAADAARDQLTAVQRLRQKQAAQ